MGMLRWVFRHLAFAYFKLDVRGLERIPASGGAIIAGNHPNVLDGILLQVVSPRPVRFLVAEELYFHRFMHWGFRAFNCVPVYRSRGTHNGDALRAAVQALEQGDLLGIFPEGTTKYRGTMPSIKRGVALLAMKTGCPIVPLAFHGSDAAFPEGTKVPRPLPIRMAFGAAVACPRAAAALVPEPDLAEQMERIRQDILWQMAVSRPGAADVRAPWWKPLQVALAGLVIWPLAAFLTRTANPSLDPA